MQEWNGGGEGPVAVHPITSTIGTSHSFASAGFFLLYRSSLALCELPRLYYFTCIGFSYPLNYPPEKTSHSQHDHHWVVTGTMVVDKSVNGQPLPEIHHVNKLLPMVWNNSNVLELLTARSLGH